MAAVLKSLSTSGVLTNPYLSPGHSPSVNGASFVITFSQVHHARLIKYKEIMSYASVRKWITKHKPKPVSGLCEDCNKRQYWYLVNVTRKYTRDFTNWKYQ